MKWGVLLAGAASATAVTPIQKVIQMLGDMQTRGKKEMQDEAVQFAAYKQFCDNTTLEKKRRIKEANEAIEKLSADEAKFAADAAELGRQIVSDTNDIGNLEADSVAMQKARGVEHANYIKESTDYSESVSAIKRAIAVLQQQNRDRAQAAPQEALLQLQDEIPISKRALITAFLDTDVGTASLAQLGQAPLAHGYEFQSGGVIEMLEKLRTKFSDELTNVQKQEQNQKHAYNMTRQNVESQLAVLKEAVERNGAEKGKKEQASADAKSDRIDTTQTRDDDQKYHDDLHAECVTKAQDFKTRKQLRLDEIDAIGKAIEIISTKNVQGAGAKYLPSFIQIRTSKMTAQSDDLQKRVATFLTEKAEEKHSRVLMQVAAAAAASPFKKVIDMIRGLVTRLQNEAVEEAEHNGWCKKELAVNKKTRENKEREVQGLSADIEGLEASIAKAKETMKELTAALGELDAAMAQATELRKTENEKNTTTIAEAKEAQTAVGQALTVLRDFYAKAGTSTAFLQGAQKPEIFDDAYTGMQGTNGGVVGMLEVIESDFARLEADTEASEASASKQFDEFMTDSKVDKAQKSTQVEHLQAKKQDEDQELVQKKEDLVATQNLLDSANAAFDKLKPACLETGVTYEERVAKREAEVESLQEALKILSEEQL